MIINLENAKALHSFMVNVHEPRGYGEIFVKMFTSMMDGESTLFEIYDLATQFSDQNVEYGDFVKFLSRNSLDTLYSLAYGDIKNAIGRTNVFRKSEAAIIIWKFLKVLNKLSELSKQLGFELFEGKYPRTFGLNKRQPLSKDDVQHFIQYKPKVSQDFLCLYTASEFMDIPTIIHSAQILLPYYTKEYHDLYAFKAIFEEVTNKICIASNCLMTFKNNRHKLSDTIYSVFLSEFETTIVQDINFFECAIQKRIDIIAEAIPNIDSKFSSRNSFDTFLEKIVLLVGKAKQHLNIANINIDFSGIDNSLIYVKLKF